MMCSICLGLVVCWFEEGQQGLCYDFGFFQVQEVFCGFDDMSCQFGGKE